MIYLFHSLIIWKIFNVFWENRIPQLSFYDEFISILLLVYIVIKLIFQKHIFNKNNIVILYVLSSVVCIFYFSILSFIYNNSPLTNLLLFIFGIIKTFIIIISAYLSKIDLHNFIKKYINILEKIFIGCVAFIFYDCVYYLLGGNVIFTADWTGNIFVSAHDLCAISLMLFMFQNYRSLYLFNKIGIKSIFYLTIALLAGNWSLILLFIPLYFIILIKSKLISMFRFKWIGMIVIFLAYSYHFVYKSYSGLFQNYSVFLKLLPQIDYWYTLSNNNLISLQFLFFGIGPGMGGSPTAEKFNTDFFMTYFYPYVIFFKDRPITGLFTQPFSSINTIISDAGIFVFLIITFIFFIILFKSFLVINTNINLNMKLVYCMIFIIYSMAICRACVISSYNAGGETLLYTGCIFLGLAINSSNTIVVSNDNI